MKIPFIDIHTHNGQNSEETFAVQSLFLQDIGKTGVVNFPFSAAIHPWHVDKYNLVEINQMLEKIIADKNLLAIGETGLDKGCTSHYERQKEVLNLHIQFAQTYHKPLIIHAVKSWNELVPIIAQIRVPIILHGYSQGLNLTRQLIDLGCYFSPGKLALNPSASFVEALTIIPLKSLLFETDDSMIPIEKIYDQVAGFLNVSVELLKNQVCENYFTIFPESREFELK